MKLGYDNPMEGWSATYKALKEGEATIDRLKAELAVANVMLKDYAKTKEKLRKMNQLNVELLRELKNFRVSAARQDETEVLRPVRAPAGQMPETTGDSKP